MKTNTKTIQSRMTMNKLAIKTLSTIFALIMSTAAWAANNPCFTYLSITPGSAEVVIGKTVDYTAVPSSNGTGPQTFKWYVKGSNGAIPGDLAEIQGVDSNATVTVLGKKEDLGSMDCHFSQTCTKCAYPHHLKNEGAVLCVYDVKINTLTLTDVADAKNVKTDTTDPDTTPNDPDDRLVLVPTSGMAGGGAKQVSMNIDLTWLPTDVDRYQVGRRMRWRIINWDNEDLVTGGWDQKEGSFEASAVKATWTATSNAPRRCRVRAWDDANADGKFQQGTESARLLKVVLIETGFIQFWNEVPVVDTDKAINPNPSNAFEYKLFVFGDDGGSVSGVSFTWSGSGAANAVREEVALAGTSGRAFVPSLQDAQTGRIFTAAYAFTEPGTYQITATYKGKTFTPPGSVKDTKAYGGKITSNGKAPHGFYEFVNGTTQTTLLPFSHFLKRDAEPKLHPPYAAADKLSEKPDQELSDDWSITTKEGKKQLAFTKRTGTHTLSFPAKVGGKEIATITANGSTKVKLVPVGGDADLVRSKTQGLFFMDGSGKVGLNLGTGSGDPQWALEGSSGWNLMNIEVKIDPTNKLGKVQDLAGHLDKLNFIVPKLDIASPNGDPTDSANATNELVFDTGSSGNCRFTVTAAGLTELSAEARTLVHDRCEWTAKAVGAVNPTYAPNNRVGGSVTITLSGMPKKHDDFGRKRLVMVIKGVTKWQWYNDTEFFFNKDSSAIAANGKDPDWFFYWNQTASALNYGPHAPIAYKAGAGPSGEAGNAEVRGNGNNKPLLFKITMFETSGASNMTQYVGVLHHENGHIDSTKLPAPTGFGPQAIWSTAVDFDGDLVPDGFETQNTTSGYKISAVPVDRTADIKRRTDWEHATPFDPGINAGLTTKYQDEVISKEADIEPLDWSNKGQNHAP